MEVEVLEEVNKLREEEEGANRVCWEGGPTKLPEKGGGQHQRPGKEEPLVGKEDGEENLRRRLTNKESELVLQHLDDWQEFW